MADFRQVNEDYAEIVKEIIAENNHFAALRNAECSIVCLSSNYAKKGAKTIVHAQCEKVADKYKWSIPADYTITVFEPNIVGFSGEQIKILLEHELMHIDIVPTDNGLKFGIRPHDLEDFKYIIDKYGVDWNEVEALEAAEDTENDEKE